MRRFRMWGLGLALVMGLFVASATAADDDDEDVPTKKTDAGNSSWFSRWLRPGDSGDKWRPAKFKRKTPPRKVDDKKADDKKADKSVTKAVPEQERPAPLVDDATLRAREEAAWVRRVKVCEELKEIAVRTNDKELERQAWELDERIWNTYTQRAGRLPAGAAGLDADEVVLEKHQSAHGSAGLLSNTATGTDPNRHAAREDKP